MFDYLKVECPHINEFFDKEELAEIHADVGSIFQTKSLEGNLDTYAITNKGRLVLHGKTIEKVPVKDRPYWGTPEWKIKDKMFRNWYRKQGETKIILMPPVDTDYHGWLHFYVFRKKKMMEFRAKFTDGNLMALRLLEDLK